MRDAYLALRSAILWAVSGIHFAIVCTFLILLGIFVDPRKNDWPQRFFFRNILRLAGAKFEVVRSPGFDPVRTSTVCMPASSPLIPDSIAVYREPERGATGFDEWPSGDALPVSSGSRAAPTP